MPAVRAFTELLFWQRARAWSKEIFGETRTAPFSADRRLVAQINDSSESVMANVAEALDRVRRFDYTLGGERIDAVRVGAFDA